MYSGGIRTNSSRPCVPADTSKHYITLIVFVKSWGFPLLQAHLTRARQCACNLAFLYILLLNAVELSLCVSTKKSRAITVLLREKEKMNEVRLTVITIITSFR